MECDFHFSVQYRTPLSQFEDKSVQHCSLYCYLAVWLCKAHEDSLIKTLRKTKKQKKKKNNKKKKTKTKNKKQKQKQKNNNNKTKLCGVPDVHKENQHPMGKEESH